MSDSGSHPEEGSEVVLSDGRVGTVIAVPSAKSETPFTVLLADIGVVHVARTQIAEVRDRHIT